MHPVSDWSASAAVQDTAMKVRAAHLAIALLATGLAIGLSGATVHADEGWIITSFHSDITIAGDSSLTIKEDIRVDFGSLHKHGIFRTIPLRYRFDDTHDRVYDLAVVSVTDGSRPRGVNC